MRVDFNPEEFEQIILQKGRDVFFEKSLPCPCKITSANALPNCSSCGGGGWIFCDGKICRMVVQGIGNGEKDGKGTLIGEGGINLTFSYKEEVSFMDRITLMTETSSNQEVCIAKKNLKGEWFVKLSYIPISIQFAGVFINANTKIEKFDYLPNTSITNLIKFNLPTANSLSNQKELSLTIRYRYAPSYNVTDINRETVQSFKLEGGGERLIKLAGKAVAKKSHSIFRSLNFLDLKIKGDC
jgi:hypothetical protein